MKRWQRIVSIIFVLMISLINSAYADSIIKMDVTPGYEGVMVQGGIVPIDVAIEAIGSDVQGTIKVSYKNDDNDVTVGSEMAIQLVNGSPKKYVIPLTIEQDIYTYQEDQFLLIEVFNQSGKLLANQVVGISEITNNYDLITGVLSNQYVGFTYFNLAQVQLDDGDTRNINTLKIMPSHFEEPIFLEALNILVVDEVPSTLSEKALSNIKEWVNDGGVLLLSTGEQLATQKQFLDAFEINLTETLRVDSEGALGNIKQIEMTDENFVKNMALEGVYSKSYGNGRIALTTYSLSAKEIVESAANTQTIASIVQEEVINKGYKRSINQNDFRNLRNILNRVPREQMPSIEVIMMIITIYILIVGPFGYLVLKQRGQTSYYWRLVAVMAASTTIIVFIAGRGIDFNKTIANGLTVIDQRSEQTQTTSFLGIKYSGIGDVDIAPESGQIKWSGSYAYGESPKSKTYYLDAHRQHVVFGDVKKFQFVNMMIEDRLDINNAQQRIMLSDNATEVIVTNPFEYPLTNVVVLMNGVSHYVDRLEANEEKSVEIEASVFDQNGNRWNTYAFYDYIDPDMEDLYEKNRVVESFFDSDRNGTRNAYSKMIVFGFVESPSTQAISINDKTVNVMGNGFWVDSLELGKPSDGMVKLPFGSVVPAVSLHGETYYDDYDRSYYGYGEAEFTYQLPTWIKDGEVILSFDDRVGMVYKVYNPVAQAWEELYFTDGNYELALKESQLSSDNIIRLMAINNSGDSYYGPMLEAKGVVNND